VPDAANNPVTTPTHPYQLRRWQPAQPVASYDSVRIVNNALYIPPALRVASTVLEVDLNLNALSVRAEAGRQIAGKHFGYKGMVPLLQITNAAASEVVFSDFETADTPYSFGSAGNGSAMLPHEDAAAARTGNMGYVLPAGSSLTTALPASTAPQYLLVFWARASAAISSAVTVTSGSSAVVFTSPLINCPGSNQWQRCELLVPLAALTNRTSYQLAITASAANSADLQVDDVLLLPAEASASSATYTLTAGKTSETDARGRTTYYEYAPTGDLALLRDHNRAIVHQFQKVLPGQTLQSGISFAISGTLLEGENIGFTAITNLVGPLQYKWDFGDGTISSYSTDAQFLHSYMTTGRPQQYTVRLYVSSQGTEYMTVQQVQIREHLLTLVTCVAGVISFDDCSHCCGAMVNTDCNPNAPSPTIYTTFQVIPSLSSNLIYQWEFYNTSSNTQPGWAPLPANLITGGSTTTAIITVARASILRYRCRVSDGFRETVSEEFAIDHYRSSLNCP